MEWFLGQFMPREVPRPLSQFMVREVEEIRWIDSKNTHLLHHADSKSPSLLESPPSTSKNPSTSPYHADSKSPSLLEPPPSTSKNPSTSPYHLNAKRQKHDGSLGPEPEKTENLRYAGLDPLKAVVTQSLAISEGAPLSLEKLRTATYPWVKCKQKTYAQRMSAYASTGIFWGLKYLYLPGYKTMEEILGMPPALVRSSLWSMSNSPNLPSFSSSLSLCSVQSLSIPSGGRHGTPAHRARHLPAQGVRLRPHQGRDREGEG